MDKPKKNMKSIRFPLLLDERMSSWLRARAEETERSVAQVIRELVLAEMKRVKR